MRGWPKSSARASCSACSALLALLVLAGCRKSERPIEHVEVLVRTGIGVDREQAPKERDVEAWAKRSAAQIPRYEVRSAASGEIPWQLRVGVQVMAGPAARPDDAGVVDPAKVYREVIATADLFALARDPKSGDKPRHHGEATIGENCPASESFEALTQRVVAQAIKDVETGLLIDEATDAEVLRQLQEGDRRAKSRALEAVRDRKLRGGADALIKILGDDEEEPELVMKAIGALVALKETRAVGPMIDSARRRPSIYLGQIIFGVAEIGGKEAEAYLFTVASGHPDPEMRSSAERALSELQRRRDAERPKGEAP